MNWRCNGWKSQNMVQNKSWLYEQILQGGWMEPFCLCNGRGVPQQTRWKETPRQMRELKYMGDIESYLTDMETLNFKICLVGTPWRTLLRDGLSEDLSCCLATTKWQPRNSIDCVNNVWKIPGAMEEYLMLQKKQSLKDNSLTLKRRNKNRKCQDEEDQREDRPKNRGWAGKSDTRNWRKRSGL